MSRRSYLTDRDRLCLLATPKVRSRNGRSMPASRGEALCPPLGVWMRSSVWPSARMMTTSSLGETAGVVHRWHLGEQDRYSSIYRPQDIHSMDMGSVLRVGYGRDGERIVLATHDGRLLTWEFDETGERVARELDLGHRGESLGRSAKEAGVSPAGATIRSAEVLLTWADDFKVFASSEGGNRINVWDLSTTVYHQSLQWLGRLPPPRTIEAVGQPAIVALALSPDGGSLATGHEDGSVRLLTLERARTVAEGTLLSGPDERISELQFSADGRQLAAAAADRMYLWETDT